MDNLLKLNLIYHEKQDGALCGLHCINNLLQDLYFTPINLANYAAELDKIESNFGLTSKNHISQNVDDSGFFSIQVLNKALGVWNLELLPYNSSNQLSQAAKNDVNQVSAFICNYQQHWFCIRKFDKFWCNLNSLIPSPDPLTPTYLSLYLAQLEHEGYSIFVVKGALPISKAELYLHNQPKKVPKEPISREEIRNKRALFLDRIENKDEKK